MLTLRTYDSAGRLLSEESVETLRAAEESAKADEMCVDFTVRGPGVYEEYVFCWDMETEVATWKRLDCSKSLANNYGCDPDVDPEKEA